MSEDQDNKPTSEVEAVADTSTSKSESEPEPESNSESESESKSKSKSESESKSELESESESESESKAQEEQTPPASVSVDNKPTSPTPTASAAKSDIETGVTASSPNSSVIPGAFAVNNPLFDDERAGALQSGSQRDGGATTLGVANSAEYSPTDPQTSGSSNPSAEGLPLGLPVANMATTVAVAVAVENEPLESDPGGRPKPERETKTIVFVAVVFFLVVVIGVAIGFLSGGNEPSPLAEVGMVGGADDDADAKLLEDRYSAMIALLAPLSDDGPGVFDPNHPDASADRINALRWIVEDDSAKLPVPQRENSNNGNEDVVYEEALWTLRQRYVMGLFYYATNGENWKEDYKFLSPFDVCRWATVYLQEQGYFMDAVATRGAICDEDGRISLLQLYWNNLSGTIPHELSLFSDSLTEINIGGGSISGTIPSSLSQFSKLKSLVLNDHCLTGSIPEGLDKISSITIAAFHGNANQLTGSLNGICYNATTPREGAIWFAMDSNTDCDCCYSCDPDKSECSDPTGMTTFKFWNMGGVEEMRAQFEKECVSPEQKEFLLEECPCVVNRSPDMEEYGFMGVCDANCTDPNPDYVYNG
jgi:hypothetical protein